jgi:hypothetical protein
MSAETGFWRVRATRERGVDLVSVDMTISFRLVDSGTGNSDGGTAVTVSCFEYFDVSSWKKARSHSTKGLCHLKKSRFHLTKALRVSATGLGKMTAGLFLRATARFHLTKGLGFVTTGLCHETKSRFHLAKGR